MTQSWNNPRFKKSCLAGVIAVLLSPSVYALESLSDEHLSETTGEGVALVLDDFKMVFQGPKDISNGSSYARGLTNPGEADTGFIRIIPTGENYQQLADRAYANVYQPAYNAQYQTSYTSVYSPSKTTEFNRIQSTERTTAYNEVNTAKRTLYTNDEKEFKAGTVAQERYDYYYNTVGSGGWLNAANSRTKATNDVNNVATYVNQITAKVTNKITAEANVLGDQRATAKADTYALAQVNLDTNKQIKNTVNGAVNLSTRQTKADVFIYGLALSKSDGSLATRFSNLGFSWGTTSNPWLFRAGTEKVRQFTDTEKELGYLALEAPLATIAANEADNNIKLGFWTDIFARSFSSSNFVDPKTGAPNSGLDVTQRLRLQFVANGLSLNGSQVRLFQTLPSSNADYNQTLGMASIIRLNTNDSPEGLTATTSNLDSKGIRISTAAKNDQSDGNGPTPAMNSSSAPLFNEYEGLYIYSPNINLVLGNMYQPFIVGSEGNNIILEVTRIPNIPSIYNQIYQNYGGGLGTTALKGSTCNVYSCGTAIKNSASESTELYQGRNATHSSIAIGSSERIAGTNMLRAKQTDTATGIMFKNTTGISKNFGSAVIDGVLIQHLKIKTTGL
ncbi:hypothetical protein E0H80_09195 [Acinetobacter sp. ANC 4779]|uniref:hypothetical protein n=1 Tax=Acinetobacter sp. ANC 4779 TaxID=2529848 RepID=UPI0010403D3A|nr:hypothetical protein [Acinetobacter sp. ANC 4779]TCB50455.1 hypothetical protein E0H80_09195 [Acinetobacter sp. ANC 4779]